MTYSLPTGPPPPIDPQAQNPYPMPYPPNQHGQPPFMTHPPPQFNHQPYPGQMFPGHPPPGGNHPQPPNNYPGQPPVSGPPPMQPQYGPANAGGGNDQQFSAPFFSSDGSYFIIYYPSPF